LEQKWNISEPTFVHSGVEFDLSYPVSDYIEDSMVSFSLWDTNCQEGEYEVTSGFISATLVGNPAFVPQDGDGQRTLGLSLRLESQYANQEQDILYFYNDQSSASAEISFCVRFSLGYPSRGIEVNFIEMLVYLSVDLSDGFEIAEVQLQPVGNEVGFDQDTGVEAYFCDENGEMIDPGPIAQGTALEVCVIPDQRSRNLGFAMEAIDHFTWIRVDEEGNVNRQSAIVGRAPAGDGLTELICYDSYCKFETLLKGNFYAEVMGTYAPSSAPTVTYAPSAAPTAFNEFDYCAQFLPNVIIKHETDPIAVADGLQVDAYTYTRELYNYYVTSAYVNFNDDSQTCTNAAYPTCTTSDHPSCSAGANAFDSNGMMTMSFSGSVQTATSGCCTANSCVSAYLDTQYAYLQQGDTFSYTYRAIGGSDWYEAAIVLFRGTPPARIGESVAVEVRVVRGESIGEFITESFQIPSAGNYFLAFFTGSYDRTGGGALGASMEVIAFSYNIQTWNQPTPQPGEPTPAPTTSPAPTPAFCQDYDFGRRYLEELEQGRKLQQLGSSIGEAAAGRELQSVSMSIGGEGVATLKFPGSERVRGRQLRVGMSYPVSEKSNYVYNMGGRSRKLQAGGQFSIEGEIVPGEYVFSSPRSSSVALLLGTASCVRWWSTAFLSLGAMMALM